MKNVLVTYFSATGTTKRVAEQLAAVSGAHILEITPAEPYTAADLNWNDKTSRSTLEMRDESSRPAIVKHMESIEAYDVVFVGFPVWWYREPSIIDTFLESYDFAGKTIVPFCTSGGSGLGQAPQHMQSVVKQGTVVNGKRFNWNTSDAELENWVATINNL